MNPAGELRKHPKLSVACHGMPCHATPCHAMPCHTIPDRTISLDLSRAFQKSPNLCTALQQIFRAVHSSPDVPRAPHNSPKLNRFSNTPTECLRVEACT